MGKLLSKCHDEPVGVGVAINIDDNAKVSKDDKPLADLSEELSKLSSEIIENLQKYQGCTSKVRKAILNPKSDIERETLDAIKPAVLIITDCYILTILNQNALKLLLIKLAYPTVKEGIENSAALVKNLIEYTQFMLEFDRIKAHKPEVQNDFAYYRRTFNNNKNNYKSIIPLDMTDNILLFFASAYPIITRFRTSLENTHSIVTDLTQLKEQVNIINEKTKISTLAPQKIDMLLEITKDMSRKKIQLDFRNMIVPMASIVNGFTEIMKQGKNGYSKKMRKSIKKCNVVLLLGYDAMDENGVLGSKSLVPLKYTIKAFKTELLGEEESLLSTIRYNAKGLYTPDTPKNITNLLTVKKR